MKTTEDIFKKEGIELIISNEVEVENLKSNPERYAGIYKEIAEILGDVAVNKIWKHFSGMSVTFPQKLLSKEYTKEFIEENWREMSAAEIARVVGLSERRVRQIIKEIKEDK
ncbi:MAG: hypothetical protein K5675_02955 [Lachnospiraceae bacterium]|nr:hypothetical protein [Lachnospiraceae bacterium]